jgi:uncharacterized protein
MDQTMKGTASSRTLDNATASVSATGTRFRMGFLLSSVLTAILIFAAGCGKSPASARKELAQLNKDYSPIDFLMSVAKGDRVAVELFIKAGMDLNVQDSDKGLTALIVACAKGHKEIAGLLLNHGANVNPHSSDGNTALMVAAGSGEIEILRLLLAKGADANAQNDAGSSPLMFAAGHGKLDCVKALIDAHVTLEATNRDGDTAVDYAREGGHDAVLQLLRDAGARMVTKVTELEVLNISRLEQNGVDAVYAPFRQGEPERGLAQAKDFLSTTASHMRMEHPEWTPELQAKHIRVLGDKVAKAAKMAMYTRTTMSDNYSRGQFDAAKEEKVWTEILSGISKATEAVVITIDVNARRPDGTTALMSAEDAEMAKAAILKGAKLDAADNTGMTALHHAAWNRKSDVAKLLLENGANVAAKSANGMTAIMYAGNAAVAELLLARGAKLEASDDGGTTPLQYAVWHGGLDVVKVLLEHGANVAAKSTNGMTAIMYAGNAAVAEFLLSAGSRLDEVGPQGATPMDAAAAHDFADVVGFFLSKGATIDATNVNGRTALMIAARNGGTNAVRVLLDKGADKSIVDKDGMTALSYATRERHEGIVLLLKQVGAQH